MEDLARSAIDRAERLGAEFADIRVESLRGTGILVMDSKTKALTSLHEAGCGVRVFVGGAWGFSTTNSLNARSVAQAAVSAARMANVAKSRAKISFRVEPGRAVRASDEYRCKEPPSEVRVDEKMEYVLGLDRSMKENDKRISSTSSRFDDMEVQRVIANSFGTLVRSTERWAVASCAAWAKDDGIVQLGHESYGNVGGFEIMRTEQALSIGEQAASQAVRLLDSKPASAGKFTCVFDNKLAGMMAHEAFGHACEADGILAGASVLEGKLGKEVADESVSMYDDPTIRNTFGYFSFDWEGVKAKKHVLIEKGELKGFLHNLESSSRMGVTPNGSARSQAFNSPPIIRMSNTYFAAGKWKRDELLQDVKHGLLIKGSHYGHVEPAKGQFTFKCDEAYEIAKGEVGQRYRDASVSGLILEVLKNVEGMADDFKLGDPGYCGKSGQSARTTDGGPHMRVSNMVVGGLA
ncbi:MAG TPA: TldD/PmbA family protein [Thermoplasmata archaeon]